MQRTSLAVVLTLAATLPTGATAQTASESASTGETPSDPNFTFIGIGGSLLLTGYLGASTTVYALEQGYSCGAGTHAIPCSSRPYAFVPFAHYLGGGNLPGYLAGIAGTILESVGLIILVIGLSMWHPRRRPRPAGDLQLTLSGPGGIGVAIDLAL